MITFCYEHQRRCLKLEVPCSGFDGTPSGPWKLGCGFGGCSEKPANRVNFSNDKKANDTPPLSFGLFVYDGNSRMRDGSTICQFPLLTVSLLGTPITPDCSMLSINTGATLSIDLFMLEIMHLLNAHPTAFFTESRTCIGFEWVAFADLNSGFMKQLRWYTCAGISRQIYSDYELNGKMVANSWRETSWLRLLFGGLGPVICYAFQVWDVSTKLGI